MRRKSAWLVLCFLWMSPAQAVVSTTDANGQTVTLPRPAQRIVSLAPHLTEFLFAAGAGGQVVGGVLHSDFPPEAGKLPTVGGYDAFDIEAVIALRPDLVVAWRSGNPPSRLEKLHKLGIPIFYSEPRHLSDIPAALMQLGQLAGTQTQAARAAAAFRQRHEQLRARYAGRPVVRMFYQVWNRPLMTVNGEHLISDVIRLCGGENVFAALPVLAPTVGVGAVLAADPEAIVASGMDASRPEWLDAWRKWPNLKAVRNDNLYFVPPDLIQRHSPRILEGAEQLCAALENVRKKRG